MSILYRWLAEDNDDADWTNDTALGTAAYAGSPLAKTFQKSSGGGFNDLGHYNTAGIAGASGLRFIVFAAISSISTTDVFLSGVNRNTSDLGNSRNFYISGSTIYVNMGGGSGVNALATNDPSPITPDQVYKLEQRVRAADGGSDFYIDDLEVISNPGTEGLDYRTGTLRHYMNMAQVGGTTGTAKWLEAYVTNDGGFTPPTPSGASATPDGTEMDVAWAANGANSTNADFFSVERSTTSGSGFVEIGTTPDIITDAYDDSGLAPGTTYYYRIRAAVVVGGVTYYSAYSTEASATTDAASGIVGLYSAAHLNTIRRRKGRGRK